VRDAPANHWRSQRARGSPIGREKPPISFSGRSGGITYMLPGRVVTLSHLLECVKFGSISLGRRVRRSPQGR
jgi:hypothetical protein